MSVRRREAAKREAAKDLQQCWAWLVLGNRGSTGVVERASVAMSAMVVLWTEGKYLSGAAVAWQSCGLLHRRAAGVAGEFRQGELATRVYWSAP